MSITVNSEFGLSEEVTERIRKVFAGFPEVEEVIIYGSRAKGNYKNGSDIDFVFKGGQLSNNILSKINQKLDDLLLPSNDLVVSLEILFEVNTQLVPGKVFDMTYGRLHHKVLTEISSKGSRFGWRFYDEQRLRHEAILCIRNIFPAIPGRRPSVPAPGVKT